jgi:hypothetical protein
VEVAQLLAADPRTAVVANLLRRDSTPAAVANAALDRCSLDGLHDLLSGLNMAAA